MNKKNLLCLNNQSFNIKFDQVHFKEFQVFKKTAIYKGKKLGFI